MTRLVITDLAAAEAATAALPQAAARYAARLQIAAQPIGDAAEPGMPPGHVLDALAATEAQLRGRVAAARDELMLLLADAGVSNRSIAGALGVHHTVVAKAVKAAAAERAGVAAEAAAEADRLEGERQQALIRARQELDA